MRLTDISVRQLPLPAKGQRIYFDDNMPNFGCRVSQGGTRTFIVQHGTDRRLVTIGRYPTIMLADARKEAKRILAEHVLGKRRPKTVTWDEAMNTFIAGAANRIRPSTLTGYQRILNKHFRFARKPVADIERDDIIKRLDKLRGTPSEQKHTLVVARIFFRWCLRRGYVFQDPTAPIKADVRLDARERVLDADELKAVYRAAMAGTDTFATIVALLIHTGQRRGETVAMKWEWIDTEARTITLPSAITKNRRTHVLPYGDGVAALLERIPRTESPYLFPASRATWRDGKPTTVYNGWPKDKVAFEEACGITGWTLHDLRRTFATNMAALGIAPHVTERLLNHVSGTISGVAAIYNRHAYRDEMRDAINVWDMLLAKVLRD